jgi:hypothetical protein
VVDVLSSADAGRITAPFRLAAPRVRRTNIVDVFMYVLLGLEQK